jgi:hypothetical protein
MDMAYTYPQQAPNTRDSTEAKTWTWCWLWPMPCSTVHCKTSQWGLGGNGLQVESLDFFRKSKATTPSRHGRSALPHVPLFFRNQGTGEFFLEQKENTLNKAVWHDSILGGKLLSLASLRQCSRFPFLCFIPLYRPWLRCTYNAKKQTENAIK